MKCPNCGQDNPSEAKFCGACSTALGPGAAPPPQPPVGEPVSDGLKIGILIGAILIPLLGIIMGLIYMNDPNPQKKAVGKLWLYVGIAAFVLSCACVVSMGGLAGMR